MNMTKKRYDFAAFHVLDIISLFWISIVLDILRGGRESRGLGPAAEGDSGVLGRTTDAAGERSSAQQGICQHFA